MTRARLLEPAPAPDSPIRVVTAAALFDGHDAAIHIMRRLLQELGCEVIHLGHDRSVDEIVTAALQEDADAVAVSSYQGGHLEFFRYLVDQLRERGADHIRIYGGGGGTIVPDEIEALQRYGVARIFSPEDGQRLGLRGMLQCIVRECSERPRVEPEAELERLCVEEPLAIARLISFFERGAPGDARRVADLRSRLDLRRKGPPAPVVGVTGTGGAGKSTLVDECVRRFQVESPSRSVAILSVDPTRRRSGGALLGDRIRMNAIRPPRVFVHSMATRRAHLALSGAIDDAIRVVQAAGFDWIVVETAGIGQADSEIVDRADLSVYVMTPEFGAPSQLEKIDMLELADLTVLNKFDRAGASDALRDVRRQWRRSHDATETPDEELPIFPAVASRYADRGTDRVYRALAGRLAEAGFQGFVPAASTGPAPEVAPPLIPAARVRYLAEIAQSVRLYRERTRDAVERARDAQALARAIELLREPPERLREQAREALAALDPADRERIEAWPETLARYRRERQSYRVRDREIEVSNRFETLSGLALPRVAAPELPDWGERIRFLREENLPGFFPFTAGVFPFRRTGREDPTRMFAGEGPPERTNRRFHLLSSGQPSVRLSTAFDSVTLYGRDPEERPDVFGKVGTSGVSVCSLDDAKKLYSGFDLLDPSTSVSMTINGPAAVILAFFLNTAIDQAVERHLAESGRLEGVRARLDREGESSRPRYLGPLPQGHDGLGLALLGTRGDRVVDPETYSRIRADALARVRGTVQADILKEDQAQNTCIFSTEFSLRLMGDVQEYFCAHDVRNFYSVSVSGYHIAEAGANPLTQLAFTLANGFTYCEYYLARGLEIDTFAPSFSFFFSNGLDAEYAVIGRVARRIWAIAMRERYGAATRSQKLKYHIQTSGRSLHAQEMSFNDIRTTIQAFTALCDRCNSLHTNAFDEAVTTPTEESVRRALAIQLILTREFGTLKNENPLQGAILTRILTDRVEEAVLEEFDRLAERGGVLGAMETMYQRGRIQDESLHYESLKHSGELPVVGVNTFVRAHPEPRAETPQTLVRASLDEKRAQLEGVRAFQRRHRDEAPAALARLRAVALAGGNVFEELMETVKVASLGQITEALFEAGGRYRRAM
ncbi:MAG: methylmalonyl-CoA mutase family protein [Myxococcota bacterium]